MSVTHFEQIHHVGFCRKKFDGKSVSGSLKFCANARNSGRIIGVILNYNIAIVVVLNYIVSKTSSRDNQYIHRLSLIYSRDVIYSLRVKFSATAKIAKLATELRSHEFQNGMVLVQKFWGEAQIQVGGYTLTPIPQNFSDP